MGPAFAWLLALRYLVSRWINVTGVLGVALAVWALIVVRAVFSGFIADIRTDVHRTSPDLLVTALPAVTDWRPLQQALADDDVVAMAPRLRHYGVFFQRAGYHSRARTSEVDFTNVGNSYVQLLGIDPALEPAVTGVAEWLARAGGRDGEPEDQQAPLPPELSVPDAVEWQARKRARLPVPRDVGDYRARWPGLLLGRLRSRALAQLQPGDPLDLLGVDFAPAAGGATKVKTLKATFAYAGSFDTGHRLFDETTALVPIEALRTMLGQHALSSDSIALVTDVALRARPGLDEPALQALAARLLPRVRAVLPEGAAPEVLTWEQQNQVFLDAVDLERALMGLVLFVVMLIAAFLIYATLSMMATQKVKDIGILSALGGAPSAIGSIFTRCGFVIGVLGGLCGAAAGVVSVRNLNSVNDWMFATFGVELFPRALFDLPAVPTVLEGEWILAVALAAFGLSLLVAWLPARRAARMHPVTALAYE